MASLPLRYSRDRGGFTSIELLFALAIFLVVSAGVSISFTASRNLTRTSQETDVVASALQVVAQEMLANVGPQIPVEYPAGQARAYDQYGLKDLVVVPTYPNLEPGRAVPSGLEIELLARWTSFRGDERTQSFWIAKGP